LIENDTFEQVVGERSGYVKGMGFGPLPPKTRKHLCEKLQKEIDHIRREHDEARMEREEARKERNTLTRKMARVEDQQQEMHEQLNIIMQAFHYMKNRDVVCYYLFIIFNLCI
jgi:FtsZ-binding cell division protein ZapB